MFDFHTRIFRSFGSYNLAAGTNNEAVMLKSWFIIRLIDWLIDWGLRSPREYKDLIDMSQFVEIESRRIWIEDLNNDKSFINYTKIAFLPMYACHYI